MEEGPGLSLFQGSDSIQLNAAAQRLEEDEEQEDIKRRDEEIKDLLTNAFDDLEEEDDDVSSVNSSHYRDSGRDVNCTNTMVNSDLQSITAAKNQTVAQLQKEFGIYDRVENLNNYEHDVTTNHRSGSEMNETMPNDIQADINLYRQAATPYNNNRYNDTGVTMLETSYELTKPPAGYPRKIPPQPEECTFGDNYPYNYQTPSNHYNTHIKKYSNNGFTDTYENNVQNKQIHEFGGGDNITSDHLNHCYKTSPNGRPLDDNVAYKTAEYNSKEQLEVLYMVRMREIKRLTEELQQLQSEKEDEKNQLSRRLMLLQAEVERINISRNQAQHALVDAKAEIADLQMQMESLKENNAVLEKTNHNITEDLNIARSSVMDLQQKIAVLERAHALQTNDKVNEKFLKQAQEKHAVEMKNMQTQIDVLTDKLNAKETSYVALEHTLTDVRRAHETLMVEKGDTMNRLAQALEESQIQCRNLMATNNAQQVYQLQVQMKMLSQEKDELQKNMQEIQNKLELAKSDIAQYDSLLITLEDDSDSMRQMKLGELHNKSKSKPVDDITNKLRGELQRCVAGQAVKRKEISRLENTLSQKEKELNKALTVADTCRQETALYFKRVNELEQELKSVLTDQAIKANNQIQKLSDHLKDVKKQYELLRDEKASLEQKLEEALAINQETLQKLHEESMEQQKKEVIDEYNKEYLEIHAKAVERVKQEAQSEIVQLSVQLEQKQKELDRVKELYIDVCGTKERLIYEHKNEIKMLKNKYTTIESHHQNVEKLEKELQTQIKLCNKLNKECESFKDKTFELEKDLAHERRKKEEHTRKIHSEIERAKQEALNELRNAHPNQEISFLLPDHCSEHLEKINQLEEDCKRLEEKLQLALQEQRRLSEYQTELDDSKLKIAQVEISQESWKKKYENSVSERNDLLGKMSKLDLELMNLKRTTKLEDSDDVKLKIGRLQMENETLKTRYDNLLSERNACKNKTSELEIELSNTKKKYNSLENKLRRNGEISLNSKSELEKELAHYKDLVTQLSRLNNSKEGRINDFSLEQRIKQLEQDLRSKDEKLNGLKDFEKIKDERDQLVTKLRNQAKQFEQYVKSQNQVSAELNLSPRSTGDTTDFQKMKEIMAKEVREEMEQRVVKELRSIGEQYLEKKKELEEKYKKLVLEWQTKYNEKDKETETLRKSMMTEKVKVNKISQVGQLMESQLETCNRELQTRKLEIEKLDEELKQKQNEVEEERNFMAQLMTKWVAEIKEIKAKEAKQKEEVQNLKSNEDKLNDEIKILTEKEKHMKSNMDLIKHKYQMAKKTAYNYKDYAAQKEKFLSSECKRIEEGYKKAMNEVQQNFQTQEERYTTKVRELECQYTEKMKQMELTLEYKNKC